MPITVKDLLQSRQELALIYVKPNDSVAIALEKMSEKDFSQLPVLDSNENFLGMVTNNSILDALRILELTINELRVSHALVRDTVYEEEEDLSRIFDELKRKEAVVIQSTSEDVKLRIVTIYDMAEYFRKKAENLILLKNIEISLKDHIRAAFLDDTELTEAVEAVSDKQAASNFDKAIKHYENLLEKSSSVPNFNRQEAIEQVFRKNIAGKQVSALDDLTLNNFIDLLLSEDKGAYRESNFAIDDSKFRGLLDSVRKIRNDIFHFRREFIAEDSKVLHFCSDWLSNHPPETLEPASDDININLSETSVEEVSEAQESKSNGLEANAPPCNDSNSDDGRLISSDIERKPSKLSSHIEVRYSSLVDDLKRQSDSNKGYIEYTFLDIERFIAEKLPSSARQNRSWWINDDTQPWVTVDWYVSNVNMPEEKVAFIYRPNSKKYIEFFDSLLKELRDKAQFTVRIPIQDGRSYVTAARLPERGRHIASLTFHFSYPYKSFRVEVFVNSDDKDNNKLVFLELQKHKDEIESELGSSLVWEPRLAQLEKRISMYYKDGDKQEILITDSKERLVELRNWSIEAMIKLHNIMEKRLSLIA